jgi:uncharacterized protein YprB with RNaseH-like and TPR domain
MKIQGLLMSKKKKELRCIHRHTLKTHPNCFIKGLVKTPFESENQFVKLTGKPWYTFPGYKIGYLDIETDGLFADFDTMLTWCIKQKDGDIIFSQIKKQELFERDLDKRLVSDLLSALKEFKIIVTYYGTGFDLPFIRSKALRYNLDFPKYGELYHWDLYYTVRHKMRLQRNSLANVCDFLGIVGKTPIEKDVWRAAKYGDKKALDLVLEHNIADVDILEQLHNRIDFTRKVMKRSI